MRGPSNQCRGKAGPSQRKHGPYNQLRYVHQGKHTTQSIRREQVADVQRQPANFKRFRKRRIGGSPWRSNRHAWA